MADLYEELVEEIKLLIEDDVRLDEHGNMYGHERVAEALAFRIEYLVKEIQRLEEDNERMKQEMKDYDEDLEEAFRLKEW